MMTVIGFALVALVGSIFLLLAITPLVAEAGHDLPVRRREMVSLDPWPLDTVKTIERADAA